jgi:hypothetical protein
MHWRKQLAQVASKAHGWRPRVTVLSEQNDQVRVLRDHTSQVNA